MLVITDLLGRTHERFKPKPCVFAPKSVLSGLSDEFNTLGLILPNYYKLSIANLMLSLCRTVLPYYRYHSEKVLVIIISLRHKMG